MKLAALLAALLLIGLIYLNSNLNPSHQGTPLKVPDLSQVDLNHAPLKTFSIADLNPDWTTPLGNQATGQNFPGQLMLLNFWAHWCWPCLVELPRLNQLHKELSHQGLFIVAVNLDEDPVQQEQAQEFWKENNLNMASLRMTLSELEDIFPIPLSSLPFHALVGPQGHILWSQQGALDWSHPQALRQLTELLTKLDSF